jgi:hypothetical protein
MPQPTYDVVRHRTYVKWPPFTSRLGMGRIMMQHSMFSYLDLTTESCVARKAIERTSTKLLRAKALMCTWVVRWQLSHQVMTWSPSSATVFFA